MSLSRLAVTRHSCSRAHLHVHPCRRKTTWPCMRTACLDEVIPWVVVKSLKQRDSHHHDKRSSIVLWLNIFNRKKALMGEVWQHAVSKKKIIFNSSCDFLLQWTDQDNQIQHVKVLARVSYQLPMFYLCCFLFIIFYLDFSSVFLSFWRNHTVQTESLFSVFKWFLDSLSNRQADELTQESDEPGLISVRQEENGEFHLVFG